MKATNEVIVGNIGTVYYGFDDAKAQEKYDEYCLQSIGHYGRASGEPVYWMRNGEVYKELVGETGD